MAGPSATPAVVPLSRAGEVDPSIIGGKALGFAVIARAGLEAPAGFVVTTAAYRAARDAGRVPDQLAGAVSALIGELGDVPLAVRSSATGEDGVDASHAGQYLTRLGVRGPDAALAAIVECWESATADRAGAYRRDRSDGSGVEMAVVVQRLADGDAAGVCMSCDPLTGDPETIVVNAAFGLGELVVSGLVTPDDYRLARSDGRLLAFEPGFKDVMLTMGADGPVELAVPPERHDARVLDDDALAALHDGVLRCERELGRPADCEFSVVGSRVVWLQCRPMTALSDPLGDPDPASSRPLAINEEAR